MYILPFHPWNQVLKLRMGPWSGFGNRGGGFRPVSGDLTRRRRGASGEKGRGVQNAPAGGLGWGEGGREKAAPREQELRRGGAPLRR